MVQVFTLVVLISEFLMTMKYIVKILIKYFF